MRDKPQASEDSGEEARSSSDWKPYERDKQQTDFEQARDEHRSRDESASEHRAHDDSASEHQSHDERDSENERATVDAMGQDKHREVIGQHGANRGRQFLYYGIFIAFIVGAYIGLKAATDSLDKAPAKDPDQAPWSKPNAPGGPLGGFEPKAPGQSGSTDFQ